VRARAAVVPDGHRLAAPDQLRAARAEAPPAPDRELARLSVARPVPAFHRKDAEAIADAEAVALERTGERRGAGRREYLVERQIDARRREMRAQRLGRLERRDAGELAAHAPIASTAASTRAAMSSSSGRSESGRRGLRGCGLSVAMAPRRCRYCAAECL